MTHRNASASSPKWHRSNGAWSLTRAGRRIAIIEPTWDDRSWFLFDIDHDGEPVFAGAWRRIATLKACLLLWARTHTGGLGHEEAPL